MKRVNEVRQTDVIMMTTDALLIDSLLMFAIDDIAKGDFLSPREIIGKLERIREISNNLYMKLEGIQREGDY